VKATSYSTKRIIIADNASTDDSISWLRAQHPNVELIQLPRNFGFAAGYNEALKQVDAPYYVLLNSDVEVTSGWLEPILDLMEKEKGIAACQPKILSAHNKKQFEYAGAAGGWIDFLGYPFAKGRIFDVCEEDQAQYNSTAEVFWASGAALVIRSKCFHEMHGFDPYFFAHMEEIDLCWRLQLAGYKVYACPDSVVYHVGGGTLPKSNPRKTYLNFRNNMVMMAKNLPLSEAVWKVPARLVLDWMAAFKFLLAGDAPGFFAVLKAQLSFFGWMFTGKRHKKHKPRKMTSLGGVYRRSIVLAFFSRKITRFKDL
jgi:GT2 family glycosyltransferase